MEQIGSILAVLVITLIVGAAVLGGRACPLTQTTALADAGAPAVARSASELITPDQLEDLVAAEEAPLLVVFHAEWCGACSEQDAVLDQLEARHASAVRIARVDVDRAPDLVEHYRVVRTPHLVLFQAGTARTERSGIQDLATLERWLGLTIKRGEDRVDSTPWH